MDEAELLLACARSAQAMLAVRSDNVRNNVRDSFVENVHVYPDPVFVFVLHWRCNKERILFDAKENTPVVQACNENCMF